MEHIRLLVAVVLTFIVFLVWDMYFVPKHPPAPPAAEKAAEKTAGTETGAGMEAENSAPLETPAETAEAPAPEPTLPAAADVETITVDTPLYTVEVSELGGTITGFRLADYREAADPESDPKELVTIDGPLGTLRLDFENQRMGGLKNAVFAADTESDKISVKSGVTTLLLTHVTESGIIVKKTFTFKPDSYLIGFDVSIENRSGRAVSDSPGLSLVNNIHSDKKNRYGFSGPAVFVDNSVEQVKIKNIEKEGRLSGTVTWFGIETQYFMTMVIPKTPTAASIRMAETNGAFLENRLVYPESTIPSGKSAEFNFFLYFGPKSITTTKAAGHQLNRAVTFGTFDFIAKPCLMAMNFIYDFIPNYGVAIIIITVLLKVLMWPLGNKSYKSMSEMKKLQPLMSEIREKYKNDKKKMNEELMSLYRTYKVNPVGGCLPMLAQIPVFFALYNMLYTAIELRHAPFFGWINDLSAPDRLFHFGFSIPFMEPPYGIPVMTVIMGATMILQQRMSPPPGDPQQARMMMLMPVVFTVIFINFSSGLVLYWLVNNIISIAQQYYVQQKTA